jgi:LETM1 and EF-hand domain-containing protein 1
LKVIETVGRENVNLKEKQLNEILDLIDKEEIIEMEEKIEKALKKEQTQRHNAKNEKADDFIESEKKIILKDKADNLDSTSEIVKDEVR